MKLYNEKYIILIGTEEINELACVDDGSITFKHRTASIVDRRVVKEMIKR